MAVTTDQGSWGAPATRANDPGRAPLPRTGPTANSSATWTDAADNPLQLVLANSGWQWTLLRDLITRTRQRRENLRVPGSARLLAPVLTSSRTPFQYPPPPFRDFALLATSLSRRPGDSRPSPKSERRSARAIGLFASRPDLGMTFRRWSTQYVRTRARSIGRTLPCDARRTPMRVGVGQVKFIECSATARPPPAHRLAWILPNRFWSRANWSAA